MGLMSCSGIGVLLHQGDDTSVFLGVKWVTKFELPMGECAIHLHPIVGQFGPMPVPHVFTS